MDNKFLFCNVSYMTYYEGHEFEEQKPQGAGKFVKENGYGMEEHNFLNYDGKCYGFVQNPGNFNLERLDAAAVNKAAVNDVTIVWCAPTAHGTVIVGWYEHATLLRQGKYLFNGAGLGIDGRYYVCYTNAEDAYLLPEKERTFEVPRAATAGKGKGFGQQNYWYADSEWAQEKFVPQVIKFLETHKENRINIVPQAFMQDFYREEAMKSPYDKLEKLLEENKYLEYLPVAYRAFNHLQDSDIACDIADVLSLCYQFTMSLEWFNKAIALEGETAAILQRCAELYCQLEDYEKAFSCLEKIKKTEEFQEDAEFQADVYALTSDMYWYMSKDEETLQYLDLAIAITQDDECREHLQQVKANHLEEMKNSK